MAEPKSYEPASQKGNRRPTSFTQRAIEAISFALIPRNEFLVYSIFKCQR